jgi:hypothetical protein
MAGQLLEPRLLMRAARQHQFALSERRANRLSALLETSRGVTLVGPEPSGLTLARLILAVAVNSGACVGTLEVNKQSLPVQLRQAIERGKWLLVAGVEASALARLFRELEPYFEVRIRPNVHQKGDWRAVVVHEPTREQRLPLPADLMRHFPLFDLPSK